MQTVEIERKALMKQINSSIHAIKNIMLQNAQEICKCLYDALLEPTIHLLVTQEDENFEFHY